MANKKTKMQTLAPGENLPRDRMPKQDLRDYTRKLYLRLAEETPGESDLETAITTVYVHRNTLQNYIEPRFKHPEELAGAIDAYWEWLNEKAKNGNEDFPDVEGFASFIRVSRATLMKWKAEREDLQPLLEGLFTDIAAVKKQVAYKGKVQPLIYLNDMQNNHGYVASSNKVDLQVSQTRRTLTDDEIQEALKDLQFGEGTE